ncbi:calcium-binding protein [Actinoplanes sp. TRM 88003]|uniref:Calcium-binding protein n=1 Tax=Paractinoplanes aksuensis TaxID=2939490 RepID=A0ABT1DWY1_9ACTN|nr:calcium-binding protein [Actinoplanes aksuensis]MCO8274551.1 calcium-binding protein [Actinoplanes aksuensis]
MRLSKKARRVAVSVLGVGVAGVAWVALPAEAATTGTADVTSSTIVRYRGAYKQTHNVVITRSGRTVTIDDVVAIKAGSGCAAVSGDKTKVRCTPAKNPTWLLIELGMYNDVLVNKADISMTAHGEDGNDRITGGPKRDILKADYGHDTVLGLGGNDDLDGSDGNDTMAGGDGDDKLFGWAGNDRLSGGNGNDELYGWEDNDVEDGGPGNDYLGQNTEPIGPDADSLYGGPGKDMVHYGHRDKGVTADADGVKGDDGRAGEKDSIGTSVEIIQGGNGPDRLMGTARADFLYGGPGNDTIGGLGGNDTLEGEAGKDYLSGSTGDDTLVGDHPAYGGIAADTMLGGPGRDTVDYIWYQAAVVVDLDGAKGDDGKPGEKDTVGADVENITGGEGSDRLTGNAADNIIDGNGGAGSNTIFGLGGDDDLRGPGRLDGGPNRTAAGDICSTGNGSTAVNCERTRF